MAYWHFSPIGYIIRTWGQTLRVGRVAGPIGQRDESFAGKQVIDGCGRRSRPGLDVTGCSGATATPKIDEDRQGDPYAAGELLVSYKPGASRRHIDGLVEKTRARVEEELSATDAQPLSFPALKHERSGRVREDKLRQAKEALQKLPGVEHVEYNYARLPDYSPNDPRFLAGWQWDLDRIGAPAAWNKVLGVGARVAIVDTGIEGDHPDLQSKIVAQKDLVNNDGVAEDDIAGHGTQVAGTVGAATNNGKGVPRCARAADSSWPRPGIRRSSSTPDPRGNACAC